jgi:hypothetical protein
MRNAYKILVAKPEWKVWFLRCILRWEISNKMYITEIGREAVDWI